MRVYGFGTEPLRVCRRSVATPQCIVYEVWQGTMYLGDFLDEAVANFVVMATNEKLK